MFGRTSQIGTGDLYHVKASVTRRYTESTWLEVEGHLILGLNWRFLRNFSFKFAFAGRFCFVEEKIVGGSYETRWPNSVLFVVRFCERECRHHGLLGRSVVFKLGSEAIQLSEYIQISVPFRSLRRRAFRRYCS